MTNQLSYIFQHRFEAKMDVVMTILFLLQTEDPRLTELRLDRQILQSEEWHSIAQDSNRARSFIDALKQAEQIVCELESQDLGHLELCFMCEGQKHTTLAGNGSLQELKLFESQLIAALAQVYPDRFEPYEDENHQPFDVSINLQRGTFVIARRVLFQQNTTYEDFKNSFLFDHQLKNSSADNVKLNRPVRFWNRDWICSMNFAQKLRLVNFRIIMPHENGIATYTDFDEHTQKKAFDQVIALLDRETSQKGVKQTLDGMICYGYETNNVMVVNDLQQHSVSLVMMLNEK